MLVEWSDLKSLLIGRSLSAQYTIVGTNYWIKAVDGTFSMECVIPTDTTVSADSLDFVTNFKTAGNKPVVSNSNVQSQPPYGSKTIQIGGVTHSLFARFTGKQYSVSAGSNVITYTATYAWAKLIGVECVNCEALDTVDFAVYDNASGTYSGTPNALLNQFSFTLNLPKDFYQRMAQFDADIYQGMVVKMTYVSQSTKTVGVNFLLDQVV